MPNRRPRKASQRARGEDPDGASTAYVALNVLDPSAPT